MRIEVPFHNVRTGETRQVKVGWSWTLFFFSGFLGLPLFLRGLVTWGSIFAGLWALTVIVSLSSERSQDAAALSSALSLVSLALSVFIGVKGNEITAKYLLSQGWRVVEPNDSTMLALKRWNITNPPIAANVQSA
ncbi:MAG TPA: hypothetical protein VJ779_04310 [Acetobacteraceae bacterium]|nr:hypothetical protein [Acetobacteraceae bacterium]